MQWTRPVASYSSTTLESELLCCQLIFAEQERDRQMDRGVCLKILRLKAGNDRYAVRLLRWSLFVQCCVFHRIQDINYKAIQMNTEVSNKRLTSHRVFRSSYLRQTKPPSCAAKFSCQPTSGFAFLISYFFHLGFLINFCRLNISRIQL